MRVDELYKFSNGTLKLVRDELHHRVLSFRLGYKKEMNRRKWSAIDKKRLELMVELIDKKMRERRIIRNLERLVGARELEMDYRLMTHEKHSNTESQPPLNRQQTTSTPPDRCRSNHHYTVVAMAAPGFLQIESRFKLLTSLAHFKCGSKDQYLLAYMIDIAKLKLEVTEEKLDFFAECDENEEVSAFLHQASGCVRHPSNWILMMKILLNCSAGYEKTLWIVCAMILVLLLMVLEIGHILIMGVVYLKI
nr:hypothetical protein [Tanacetum cinerariifolium]